MVLSGHVADDAGALHRPAVVVQPEIVVHRKEDAPVNWLEAIAHVRQRPGADHRQCVMQVAMTCLVDDRNELNRLGHPLASPQVQVYRRSYRPWQTCRRSVLYPKREKPNRAGGWAPRTCQVQPFHLGGG